MPNSRTDPTDILDPQRVYFEYTQQVSQAFVQFIPEEIERLERGDVFIAYCHTERDGKPSVIGAYRYFPVSAEYNQTDIITVPVMGNDTPYNANIYPVPPNEDGRIYCRHGDQIYISHVKRIGRTTNLNESFDITSFYNTAIEIATPLTDNIDDGSTDICNCRTFNCRDCNQNAVDINDLFLNRCCSRCCQNDDIGYQCPGYECPGGTSDQCPIDYTCTNIEGTYCCIEDNSGGTPT